MESSGDDHSQPFFRQAHLATRVFKILLALVFIGTSGQAIWQLAQLEARIEGTIVEIAETITSVRSARYELVLRTREGQFEFVRLRNNGRIMKYLADQDRSGNETHDVAVETRRDVADRLIYLDSSEIIVSESGIRPAIQFLIGLLPLFILALLLWPSLAEGRPG